MTYPLEGTRAQQMLQEGLARASASGRNQGDVAKALGYKSSVVISHMSLGRAPIPIDKAPEIAEDLNIPISPFLLAVLEQRHPDVNFDALLNPTFSSDKTVARLEAIAGCPLGELPPETLAVMEEVAAAKSPESRWIKPNEVYLFESVRRIADSALGRKLEALLKDAE